MSDHFLDTEFTLPLLDRLVDDAGELLRALRNPSARFRGRPWWVPRYDARTESEQAVFDEIALACCTQLRDPSLREPSIPLFFLQYAPSALAIPTVTTLLSNRAETLRLLALRVLGELGAEAAPCEGLVMPHLNAQTADERSTAATTLRLIGARRAAGELSRRALDDPDAEVRFWSTVAVARLDDDAADRLVDSLLRRMPERQSELAALILANRNVSATFPDEGLAEWGLSWLRQPLDAEPAVLTDWLSRLDDPSCSAPLRLRLYRLKPTHQARLVAALRRCSDGPTLARACRWIAAARVVSATSWLSDLERHDDAEVRLAARTARLALGHVDILPEWMQALQRTTPLERLAHLQRWADPWVGLPPLVMMPLLNDPTGAIVAFAIGYLAQHWQPLGVAQAGRFLQRFADRPQSALHFPEAQNADVGADQGLIERFVSADTSYRDHLPPALRETMAVMERRNYAEPSRCAIRAAIAVVRDLRSQTHLDLVYKFLFHPSRVTRYGALLGIKQVTRKNPPQVNISPETDPHVLHLWHEVRFNEDPMTRSRKISLIAVLVVLAVLSALYVVSCATIPDGVRGPGAERLAQKMARASNLDAWRRKTAAVSFNFTGRHDIFWDKARGLVEVGWRADGSRWLVQLYQDRRRSVVTRDGQPIADAAVIAARTRAAYSYFINDTFWLNPLFHIFGAGAQRYLVSDDALRVTFSSGGVTPGDTYLFTVDRAFRVKKMTMWVKILFLKGLWAKFDDYLTTETGVVLATSHKVLFYNVKLNAVRMYRHYPPAGEPDRFAPLLADRRPTLPTTRPTSTPTSRTTVAPRSRPTGH